MSFGLFLEDGNIMSFIDFINLNEAISPKETEYGTDFKNKKWNYTPDKSNVYTFFSHKPDHHVVVAIDKNSGILGFATHKGAPSTDVGNHYDETRKGHGEALKVFGKVAHVAIEGAKHHNIKHLKFNGADSQLSMTYDKMAKSKNFLENMKIHNFHYIGQDKDNNHTFEHRSVV